MAIRTGISIRDLDEVEVAATARQLVAEKAQAIVIGMMRSHRNERRAAHIVNSAYPAVPVVTSAQVVTESWRAPRAARRPGGRDGEDRAR